MSSVYRKGRDGYFYYQAYRYNPNSKKKDKRIFHSLGTRDILVAKNKQKKLDSKYEKIDSRVNQNFLVHLNNSIGLKVLLSGGGIICIFFYFSLSDFGEDKKTLNKSIFKNEKIKTSLNQIRFSSSFESKDPSLVELVTKNTQLNQELEIIEAPLYTIEKVEELNNPFKLCKINISISKKANKKSLKKICQNLTKQYSQFSNIIICVYSNDEIGKKISTGKNQENHIKDQKESWLAMYTYNPVEGEYFDGNPTRYLGGK